MNNALIPCFGAGRNGATSPGSEKKAFICAFVSLRAFVETFPYHQTQSTYQ